MSSYQEFIAERDKIDYLIQQGYKIKAVTENLSGAFVQFEKSQGHEKDECVMHILTADARKYFSSIMIHQT
ncbi:hypothetical protein [Metabacillus iocasae]|uniref:Uncharacterized protein n=1 Tax=Priestia iocasae TaxID=2291674 RepID=A0ABS2QQ93_9BACI|nr:hypothetical protein [Metabacillus iocasae]MBM7701624.1 hypothetical protein [Metabacillus iocasae]